MHQKALEIARIQEKNVRIRKISDDLKLNEEIFDPKLDSDEEPERLLKVTDEEIEIEKYISSEEKKRLEEAAKEEEERKRREMVNTIHVCTVHVHVHVCTHAWLPYVHLYVHVHV